MVSNLGNSKCPKCGEILDGVSIVRYNGPFACPFCKMELHVPGYYKVIGFGISAGSSLILCASIGLHWPGFIVGYFVFLFPSIFTVGILQRKISPPRLVACEDDSSPFS